MLSTTACPCSAVADEIVWSRRTRNFVPSGIEIWAAARPAEIKNVIAFFIVCSYELAAFQAVLSRYAQVRTSSAQRSKIFGLPLDSRLTTSVRFFSESLPDSFLEQ